MNLNTDLPMVFLFQCVLFYLTFHYIYLKYIYNGRHMSPAECHCQTSTGQMLKTACQVI